MPLFHHDFPEDMPPTELSRKVREQLNTIMVVSLGVLGFLVVLNLIVLGLVFGIISQRSSLLTDTHKAAVQAKLASDKNTQILKIIQDVTGPNAQAQQQATIGSLVDQIQCEQRRTALMLPPIPKGQPCVYPPGQEPPPAPAPPPPSNPN